MERNDDRIYLYHAGIDSFILQGSALRALIDKPRVIDHTKPLMESLLNQHDAERELDKVFDHPIRTGNAGRDHRAGRTFEQADAEFAAARELDAIASATLEVVEGQWNLATLDSGWVPSGPARGVPAHEISPPTDGGGVTGSSANAGGPSHPALTFTHRVKMAWVANATSVEQALEMIHSTGENLVSGPPKPEVNGVCDETWIGLYRVIEAVYERAV